MQEAAPEEIPVKMPEATEETRETPSEEYWKKPAAKESPSSVVPVGLWSRSPAFRVFVWVIALLAASQLALFASAYLSDFDSVFEMLSWIWGTLVS